MRQQDVTNPHFAFPMTLLPSGHVRMNEQNSNDEVMDCIKMILSFPIGSRVEVPGFGVPNIAFKEATVDVSAMLRQVLTDWEPRADLIFSDDVTQGDALIREILIMMKGKGDADS